MKKFILFVAGALYLSLPLASQIRLEGRVSGPDGKPISGALTALVPANSSPSLDKIPLIRTDAAGRFILAAGPGKVGLSVTASGYQSYFRSLELKAGQIILPIELRLAPGGCRIRGTVSDAKGRIPAGIRLAFFKVLQNDFFIVDVQNGKFEVFLSEGPYYIMAEAESLSPRYEGLEVKGPVEMKPLVLPPVPVPAGPQVRQWIKAQAVPIRTVEAGRGLEDLSPLKAVVGDAVVVALGEATHGTREFFQLKHRIFEFLAEEMEFTVFAVEASLLDAYAVNDYILTGRGDPASVLAGLGNWTCDFKEVLTLIRWMRRYNQDPFHRRKVKFYGFDMNLPITAYDQAKAWFDREDPDGAKIFEIDKNALSSRTQSQSLKTVSVRLLARLDARKATWARGEKAIAFERQCQALRLLVQWAEKMGDPFDGVRVRDEAMAANVHWIRSQEPGAKLMLWAHNSHVSFQEGSMLPGNPMGWHLRKTLGKKYLAIGFAFREGRFIALDIGPESKGIVPFTVEPHPRGTLDDAFAATGRDVLGLDLRRLPEEGPARAWFSQSQGTWGIGSGFSIADRDQYVVNLPVTDAYDAILFVARTTAALRNSQSGANGSSGLGSLSDLKPDAAPKNLGFEDGPAKEKPSGWYVHAEKVYDIQCVADDPKEGRLCLRFSFKGEPKRNDWAKNFMQAIEAKPYLGKRIRLTGWIRTDGRPGSRGRLWVRADTNLETLAYGLFDNMEDRPITAATWMKAVIEGVVDLDAKILNFGGLVNGTGTIWFDGLSLEIIE